MELLKDQRRFSYGNSSSEGPAGSHFLLFKGAVPVPVKEMFFNRVVIDTFLGTKKLRTDFNESFGVFEFHSVLSQPQNIRGRF
ncbi:hypothetical protein HM131_12980 [Halobacillus mangrovi]|uniref:Uncharacterized protein n=1 Tax=Halobacillus mangrovi TaxID=402384 RepID=A0A1W5ZWM9_9BACI|nr:hypothetical protein HM131_12980 [Halobacillus mangrovi]